MLCWTLMTPPRFSPQCSCNSFRPQLCLYQSAQKIPPSSKQKLLWLHLASLRKESSGTQIQSSPLHTLLPTASASLTQWLSINLWAHSMQLPWRYSCWISGVLLRLQTEHWTFCFWLTVLTTTSWLHSKSKLTGVFLTLLFSLVWPRWCQNLQFIVISSSACTPTSQTPRILKATLSPWPLF